MTLPQWHHAIHDYLMYLQAAGTPLSTITTRRHHLTQIAHAIGGSPWTLKPKALLAWFGSLTVAQETRRGRRTTLRSFYAWAVDQGHVSDNLAACLPKVKATRPNPRPLPRVRYETALSRAGHRERLMLRLGWEGGLRRAEIATGHSDHLVEDLDGYSLIVHGKGGKIRTIPLPHDLARDLLALPPGWFFPGRENGHLSPRWVGRLLTDLIPGDAWTTHTLRHSAATRWYNLDRDVFTAQELLGHANPNTTRGYVVIQNAALRSTVERAA